MTYVQPRPTIRVLSLVSSFWIPQSLLWSGGEMHWNVFHVQEFVTLCDLTPWMARGQEDNDRINNFLLTNKDGCMSRFASQGTKFKTSTRGPDKHSRRDCWNVLRRTAPNLSKPNGSDLIPFRKGDFESVYQQMFFRQVWLTHTPRLPFCPNHRNWVICFSVTLWKVMCLSLCRQTFTTQPGQNVMHVCVFK